MLALTMVVKDCADTLRQILGCVAPYVDEIVIVLGGESSDDTEAVAREYTEKVYPFEWCDDFSAARNYGLSFVTEPYWMWVDGDDIAVPTAQALPELVKSMEAEGYSCVWLPYIYQTDEFGNPTQVQVRERIFRRADGWHWQNRIHEVVVCDKANLRMTVLEDVTVVHSEKANKQDKSKVERNATLLRKALEEKPESGRHILALAHAEYSLDHLPLAAELYQRYYYQPESRIEQWWAACQIARIYLTLKDFAVAKGWALAALQVDGRYRDPHCLMAHACWWENQDADEAIGWATASIGKLEAPLTICRTPREYTLNLWDVLHRAYAAKGDYTKAYEIIEQAKEMEPIAHWDKFGSLYAEAVRAKVSVHSALHLADHLERRGDTLHARWLLEGYLPANIKDSPEIVSARHHLQAVTAHAYDLSAYDNFYKDTTARHHLVGTVLDPFRWKWVFERLEKAGVKTVLDVGCANGAPALELARRGYEVTGIDMHASNIERATGAALKEMLSCRFVVAGLEEFYRDYTGEPFDAVLMAEIIEHLPPHLVGHSLRRADKLGKRVLLTTPYPLFGDWPGLHETGPSVFVPDDLREHVLEFTREELEHLLVDDERHPVELYAITQPWDEGGANRQRTWVAEYDHAQTNDRPVVFYVGPGHEPWAPHDPDTGGLGGSETAVVRMAQEFANRGHRVVVYAEADGVYDGVLYRHYSRFEPEQNPWLLIVSRTPALLSMDLKAEHIFLMCHDIHYGQQDGFGKAERILLLSDWHRGDWIKRYGDNGNLAITANGIVAPTGPLVTPQPHSFIYASSPDRGLDELLRWWPAIRNMWADAELNIYYGFENLVAMAERQPHLRAFKMEIEALLNQEGVFWKGRVGQPRLHEAFAQTQFWLYPSTTLGGSDWYETYCITALEAQANGCIPITRPVGALPERLALPERCLVDSRNVKDFLKVLRRWDQTQHVDSLRQKMADYARGHTWDKVCEQWLELAR